MTVRAIAVILFCFIVANGQGTYTNPIIDADYSDPDVIRVGDDFYLTGAQNLWPVPNLLLQKLPARRFTVTTLIDASGLRVGERSGLLMMGRAYSYVAIEKTAYGLRLVRNFCIDAAKGIPENEHASVELEKQSAFLRMTVLMASVSSVTALMGRRS